jgi:hypothetical protein
MSAAATGLAVVAAFCFAAAVFAGISCFRLLDTLEAIEKRLAAAERALKGRFGGNAKTPNTRYPRKRPRTLPPKDYEDEALTVLNDIEAK